MSILLPIISHLLFHFRSGFYYFSLKTLPNCLKLNQYKFNLTWREFLPPRQLLCFSPLLAACGTARFRGLWPSRVCIQAGVSTQPSALTSLSFAVSAHLQKKPSDQVTKFTAWDKGTYSIDQIAAVVLELGAGWAMRNRDSGQVLCKLLLVQFCTNPYVPVSLEQRPRGLQRCCLGRKKPNQ